MIDNYQLFTSDKYRWQIPNELLAEFKKMKYTNTYSRLPMPQNYWAKFKQYSIFKIMRIYSLILLFFVNPMKTVLLMYSTRSGKINKLLIDTILSISNEFACTRDLRDGRGVVRCHAVTFTQKPLVICFKSYIYMIHCSPDIFLIFSSWCFCNNL